MTIIMLVFIKKKLVVLAVPKTGSTALQSALGARADMVVANPPEFKHAPIYRYDRFFRPMFQKMFDADPEIMAIVREPTDWLGSWYRYRTRKFLRGEPTSTANLSFDEFVGAYLQEERPTYANVGSQVKFLTPRPNGARLTHLFKYEHQQAAINFLESRLDMQISLKRENTSPSLPIDLINEVAARYRQKCAAEFELYESAR